MRRSLNTAHLTAVADNETTRQANANVTIHTRAQQRLIADSDRVTELDDEIASDTDYAQRLRTQLAEMHRLLEQTEKNIADDKIERDAALQSIHSLRQAGISA